MAEFGAELRRIMEERGLSGRQIAAYANVSPNTVNLWLRGAYVPRPASCAKLATALGVPLDEMLRLAGHRVTGVEGARGEISLAVDADEARLIRWIRWAGQHGTYVSPRRAYDVLRGLYHADDELFADMAGDKDRRPHADEA